MSDISDQELSPQIPLEIVEPTSAPSDLQILQIAQKVSERVVRDNQRALMDETAGILDQHPELTVVVGGLFVDRASYETAKIEAIKLRKRAYYDLQKSLRAQTNLGEGQPINELGL